MDVHISQRAESFVNKRGGTVYVRTTHHRCCSSTLTMLAASIDAPDDAHDFTSWPTDGLDVRCLLATGSAPAELAIDLKGRRRPRLEAYWDGCLFRI